MIKVFLNKKLAIAGTAYVLVCMALIILMVFVSGDSKEPGSLSPAQLVWIFLGLCLIVAFALCFPTWYAFVLLDGNGIRFKAGFKKSAFVKYDKYRFTYIAFCKHGSLFEIGYRSMYIVISQRRLSKYELEHVNEITACESVIKVKYSNESYEKLKRMLPESLISQL